MTVAPMTPLTPSLPRFKERISVPLVRILRVYVTLITSLVMALTVPATHPRNSQEIQAH